MIAPPVVTPLILQKYFSTVRELKVYLSEILQPLPTTSDTSPVHPLDNTDNSLCFDLLNTSYVGLNVFARQEDQRPRFRVFPVVMDMHEVIDRAQEKIFKSRQFQNIIAAGYRLSSKEGDRGKTGLTRPSITNHFVNTIVTALQAPEWDALLQRIGVDAMLHLLTETSIFISLPNNCLCQMTGTPIIYTAPAVPQAPHNIDSGNNRTLHNKRPLPLDWAPEGRPTKRQKSDSSNLTNQARGVKISVHSPADIMLARARIFYSRPRLVSYTQQIIVGLSDKHVLNRLNPSYQRKPKVKPEGFVDPDPREQLKKARHLSKYVFPRQYGLVNPFRTTSQKWETLKIPDYSDREHEIKTKGPCKTPKRLKDVIGLLEKMIWRHGKCQYKLLRNKVCPSKLKPAGETGIDSSVILELMSEQPSQLRSQASGGEISFDSVGNTTMSHGFTQVEKQIKAKPRFAEFSCSTVEVYRYVALVTKAVIPKAFWGCDRNLKLILKYVASFIRCRRFETLSLHQILQGFSTSECDWLMPPGNTIQNRVSVSDALKRRELLEEFIFWYFDSFVLSLLKTNFYITESSAFRNRVLYFRQDDWEALCAPLIERLTTGTFEKMSESDAIEVLRQRKLGFSFVRLLPKDTGVRPIVNLRRRKPTQRSGYSSEQSINQILQAAFQILTYEKKAQPLLLGASVFGTDEVYPKLKEFKLRLPRTPSGELPKLYFVKVDVQACFDTIDQTKLLEILRELISEDMYMTQRYGQVSISSGRIKRMFVKRAIPEDDHPHFLRYATELARALRDIIFVDQVTYPYSKKAEVLHLLEEHITENIVKIGRDYFRQTVGIPQGSVLSTLLCSFFYGDLEKRFRNIKDDLQSILLRLIDDYLLITTSLSKAKNFLDMMKNGHPEYGCFISSEKTLTNFDYDAQIMNVTEPKQKSFPWCGLMINMKDLSISVDYTRYNGAELRDTLTINRGRRPGASFVHKMLLLARSKCHAIYSDVVLNTSEVVYKNIYQNLLLSAMKMHSYLRDWGLDTNKNVALIRSTIRGMIHLSYSATRNRCPVRMPSGVSPVQKLAVIWLGTHAFHTVLGRKPQRYASLIRSLAFQLARPRNRPYKKRFKNLVKEGQAGLSFIAF